MCPTQFHQHGEFSFSLDGNIVIIKATGPFNLEFMKTMHLGLHEFVMEKLEPDNFAILLQLYDDAIPTQESINYHVKTIKKGRAKAIAVELSQCAYPSATQQIFREVYTKAELANQFFDTTEQAKKWLLTYIK